MDLIELLRRVPLFGNLDPYALGLVADLAEEHHLEPGMLLCRQADIGATFFVIDAGEALVERVDERGYLRPVRMLRDGDYFGIHSLFLVEPRDATVTAKTTMRVWSIRRPDFEALLAEHPDIRRRLLVPSDIEERLRAPRYPWLEPGEQVVYFCRRHWTSLAGAVLHSALIIAVMIVALWVARLWLLPGMGLLWPALAMTLVLAALSLWHWVDWRNDYFAVSTWRVSARERVAFIYESRNEAPLERVQNINVVHDLLGRYLGYGNLAVETAATGKMLFERIPDPERMRSAIWDQIERSKATRQAFQQSVVRDTLAAHLGLQLGEVPAGLNERNQTLDGPPAGGEPPIEPGRLARLLVWLSGLDLLPRMRIETADSVTWRKHWVFLIRMTALPLLLCSILIPACILGFFGLPDLFARWAPGYPYILLIGAVVSMGWLWWEANDWGNDLYVVTRERIIDIEDKPLWFSSQRREASLAVIQNVKYAQPHFVASLLNYGNVIIQTAGEGPFTFERVANPREVQNEIFRRIDAYRESQRERARAEQRRDLAEWFDVYHRLKDAPAVPTEDDKLPGGSPPSG